MNPLCCIAPVSIDRDRSANPPVVPVRARSSPAHPSPADGQGPPSSKIAAVVGARQWGGAEDVEAGEEEVERRDSRVSGGGGAVAGILNKWVNYGKGWRSRWFVLQDGVLSYYKIHGPDKISMEVFGDKEGVRVIGEDSIRHTRKGSLGSSRGSSASRPPKQWKPFGEIHLKVCHSFVLFVYINLF